MVQLSNNRLLYSTAAAALVISGVVTKNSLEQMKLEDSPYSMLGIAMFVSGWALTGYSLSYGSNGNNAYLNYLPCAAVVGAVMMMKKHMKAGDPVPTYLPAIFATAWAFIGYLLVNNRKLTGNYSLMAYAVPVLVLASMMWSLPKQREMNIVDGPGAYLFSIAWALFSFTNSLN